MSDDEDEGLEFYDPKEEELQRRAKQLEEEQRNQQAQLGGMQSKSNAVNQIFAMGKNKASNTSAKNRMAMLKELESAHLQAKSRHLTIDKIKETFQATGLNESKAKVKRQAVGIDGKVVELNEGDDDEDDEEYVAEEESRGDAVANEQDWDDEENSVVEVPAEQDESGEEDAEGDEPV